MRHEPLQKTSRDYRETEGNKLRSWLKHRKLLKGEMLPQNGPFLQRSSQGSSACPALPAWHVTAEPCPTCAALQSGTSIQLGILRHSLSLSEEENSSEQRSKLEAVAKPPAATF